MEFIDLLKVGANKQEAVIAYNKISEPTIDFNGNNINAILVLLLTCLEMSDSGSDLDADIFGEYSEGVFTLGKSAFDSTFGDVLHEGTYNFFTDTASIDEESSFGKGGINLTARVVRHPYLEMMMGSELGNISIYSIIPDDFYLNFILKQLSIQYLFSDYLDSDLSLDLLAIISSLPPIGIPVMVMSGDMVNEQFGEESVVMYGLGLYTMLTGM